jgi:SprT protein
MSFVEKPLESLADYLPEGTFHPVLKFIQQYNIHLSVTKKRISILGDYRHPARWGNHKISINGNLNKYEFLLTFLHELAHLLTYEKFNNRVEAHGIEWKNIFSELLIHFLQLNVFPADIVVELKKSIKNPAATANGETALLAVLRRYNSPLREGYSTIENLPIEAVFLTENGRLFKKKGKRRKRYECIEINTGRLFSFSAIAEVKKVQ